MWMLAYINSPKSYNSHNYNVLKCENLFQNQKNQALYSRANMTSATKGISILSLRVQKKLRTLHLLYRFLNQLTE
jgi:hypothetical protein